MNNFLSNLRFQGLIFNVDRVAEMRECCVSLNYSHDKRKKLTKQFTQLTSDVKKRNFLIYTES